MHSHSISGMPRCCLNRNCRAPFTKTSHLGYMMKNELEVNAVMRCPKCRDTFMVSQGLFMAHEYYEKLPTEATVLKNKNKPINQKEISKVRRQLNSNKTINELFEANPGIRDEED